MKVENISTLKIHKLTQEQYDRELAAGRIDENAIYLTPDKEIDLSDYAKKTEINDILISMFNAIGSISETDIAKLFTE